MNYEISGLFVNQYNTLFVYSNCNNVVELLHPLPPDTLTHVVFYALKQ